jgi:SAM-dependent methyltransferase
VDRYVIKGGEVGHARLRVLTRAQRPSTLDLLNRVSVGPGMRCLDLGCGSGDVTLDIAALVGDSDAFDFYVRTTLRCSAPTAVTDDRPQTQGVLR